MVFRIASWPKKNIANFDYFGILHDQGVTFLAKSTVSVYHVNWKFMVTVFSTSLGELDSGSSQSHSVFKFLGWMRPL